MYVWSLERDERAEINALVGVCDGRRYYLDTYLLTYYYLLRTFTVRRERTAVTFPAGVSVAARTRDTL